MKTTSMIFLILSLVLIIAGTAVCLITQNMAQNDGVNLFTSQENENTRGFIQKRFLTAPSIKLLFV